MEREPNCLFTGMSCKAVLLTCIVIAVGTVVGKIVSAGLW